MKRIGWLLLVAVLGAAAGCGGGESDSSGAADASGVADSSDADASDGPDWGRVVALGEEFLLADLLALGITPVASTATVWDQGFQGLDAYDTEGIEPLPATEANFERLAATRPDTIVATDFIIDEVGSEELSQIADNLIVISLAGGTDQIEELGEALGRQEQAAEVVAELDAARASAVDAAPEQCEVSLGTVYTGPTPAAWVAAPNTAAIVLEELGCTLSPSAAAGAPDQAGRIYLSLENVGLFDADDLILLQSAAVEGESASLAELEDDPLWATLPAVAAGEVHILDRLGYPGVAGQARLYDDLGAIVAEG